jgi:hypothetical protein
VIIFDLFCVNSHIISKHWQEMQVSLTDWVWVALNVLYVSNINRRLPRHIGDLDTIAIFWRVFVKYTQALP